MLEDWERKVVVMSLLFEVSLRNLFFFFKNFFYSCHKNRSFEILAVKVRVDKLTEKSNCI